jgi:hypothetical protein
MQRQKSKPRHAVLSAVQYFDNMSCNFAVNGLAGSISLQVTLNTFRGLRSPDSPLCGGGWV